MVRPMLPACPADPEARRKNQHRQEKEDAGDFQPDGSTDAGEGPQESADAADDALTGAAC